MSIVDIKAMADKSSAQEELKKAASLPTPTGYRILCAIPEIEQKIGSIIKSDQMMRDEELLATVLFVLKVGPDAYKDPTRFPSGPYCKPGDFVLVRPHAGTRVKIFGKSFRILNDDSIESVVEDPRGISRG